MDNCIKTGAYVYLFDYNTHCVADIFAVGDKRIVQFPHGALEDFQPVPQRTCTHTLFLNQNENYWSKSKGIAVVDVADLTSHAGE